MADYIYLLENRLSRAQRGALQRVREIARSHGMTVFLVGGAVRDLTSGAPIRDLDFAVQGDARVLAEEVGTHGTLVGTNDLMQSFSFSFPGGVRLELASALSVTYPQPGKPSVQPAPMLEDLRRRDFTANAMAISLNEGSYGLLMDPSNGVADVENRELRLLSNYGFLEEPSRMVRATRLLARLGWQMEEKTRTRYDNAKAEGYIAALGDWERRYEAEAIFREEDPLHALRKLEAEGWAETLSGLASAKVDEAELDRLREITGQLNALGIFPDTSAAVFPLLTAKMEASDVAAMKKAFALPGYAGQIEALDEAAKALASEFTAKSNAAPSASWKLLMAAEPEAVLWMAFNARSGSAQNKLKLFFQEWPQARTRTPHQQMQEMRIQPDMPGYDALLDDLFFAAMDGKLDTPEAIKAFLEPFSPPAAPPPPTLRRRAVKRESKATKGRTKKTATPDVDESVDLDAETTPEEVTRAAATPAEDSEEAETEAAAHPHAAADTASRSPTGTAASAQASARAPVSAKAAPAKPGKATVAERVNASKEGSASAVTRNAAVAPEANAVNSKKAGTPAEKKTPSPAATDTVGSGISGSGSKATASAALKTAVPAKSAAVEKVSGKLAAKGGAKTAAPAGKVTAAKTAPAKNVAPRPQAAKTASAKGKPAAPKAKSVSAATGKAPASKAKTSPAATAVKAKAPAKAAKAAVKSKRP